MPVESLYKRQHALVLRQGVEGDVAAATEYLLELFRLVGRAVGVGQGAELLERKPCLTETAGSGVADEIAEDGESSPKGKGLESEDDLHVGCFGYVLDKLQVATKQGLLNKIIRTHGAN